MSFVSRPTVKSFTGSRAATRPHETLARVEVERMRLVAPHCGSCMVVARAVYDGLVAQAHWQKGAKATSPHTIEANQL